MAEKYRIGDKIMFVRPQNIHQALTLLQEGDWSILAGGTDFYPALQGRPPQGKILDISRLDMLKEISCSKTHWRLGALTTWRMIAQAAELPSGFDCLKMAAGQVGSVQIQNSATIAGNLCTASPAGDGIPALLALDAHIEIASCDQRRTVPLAQFIAGYRSTILRTGEMVTAILVSKEIGDGVSSFYKLGTRRYLVISIAMSAVYLRVAADGTIAYASIGVGACSAVAAPVTALEQRLCGEKLHPNLCRLVADEQFAHLTPLDDVRGTASYRQQAVREITVRALDDCIAKAGQG